MPRTDLPSGNWVEWSSKWMSGVRFHVKAAVEFRSEVTISGNDRKAVQVSDAANDDRQRLALWGQQITAWSFADQGIPVPSQNVAGPEVIWTVLDGPDFSKLADATQDLLDEVTAVPTSARNAKGQSAT
jgi:hypothetical protein